MKPTARRSPPRGSNKPREQDMSKEKKSRQSWMRDNAKKAERKRNKHERQQRRDKRIAKACDWDD